MKPDEQFSDIIGRIYDCALDSSLWPSVLKDITEAVGGSMADLVVSHPLEGTQRMAANYNWPEELISLTVANASINPGLPLGLTMPVCQVFCSSRDLDIESFHRSRYWQKCFAGRGLYDYVVTPITRTVTSFATWGVVGCEEKGAFSDGDLELARLLSPHIKRSVEISGVIGRQNVQTGTLIAALNAIVTPALVVDVDGMILFRNDAAREELLAQRVFRDRKGRLVGATFEATKLLSTLASPATRARQRGLDALLTDADGHVLHATWAELERVGEESGSSILVLLREPEAALNTPVAAAAHLYNLTNAETQVLGQVVQGRALAEIAEIVGLRRSTVKSHLDAIYRKTDSNRQAELVSRVMALASPLKR